MDNANTTETQADKPVLFYETVRFDRDDSDVSVSAGISVHRNGRIILGIDVEGVMVAVHCDGAGLGRLARLITKARKVRTW